MGDIRVGNPIYHLLQVERSLKELSTQITGRSLGALERANQQLDHAQREELEQAQEKIAADQESTVWHYFTSLIDVVNLIFGGVLISTGAGTVAGYTLASSGLISLANTALIQAGKWNELAAIAAQGDEERQRRLATLMPFLFQILSVALGTYGLVRSGVVNGEVRQIIQKLKTLSEWLTAAVTAGTAWGDVKLHKAQGHLFRIDKDIYTFEQLVKRLSEEVSDLMRLFQEASSKAKKPAKAEFELMQNLTKKT